MIESIYNFLQLSENIVTSGQPTEDQIVEIHQAGFEVVINLGLTGTDYALEDEAGLIANLGMKYIHIPVIWENPTLEDLDEFLSTMDLLQGKKIFVHCAANMRVSAFMALYRVLRLGWEPDRAMEDVHRIWEPNAVWDAFIKQALND
jgi:protein tyrosine phosphatase (PTP) superfamily phosphohydrolase (DUF442 family)